MSGRSWSDGLHQAVEAKEQVEIERETQTLATITIQNYFRLYHKLAGMTGTAETEAHARAPDRHVADRDIAKHRRAVGHRRLAAAHLAFHQVVVGDVDALAHIVHSPVVEAHVFHSTAATPAALDAH